MNQRRKHKIKLKAAARWRGSHRRISLLQAMRWRGLTPAGTTRSMSDKTCRRRERIEGDMKKKLFGDLALWDQGQGGNECRTWQP